MTATRDDWNQRTEGVDGDDCDYAPTPSFRSTADLGRMDAIFDKAAEAGAIYHEKYGNPWGRMNRGQQADMDSEIQDAKAKSRTLKPLFGTINQCGERPTESAE